MKTGAGVRYDPPGRDRTTLQRPEKTLVPVLSLALVLDSGKRRRDPLIGRLNGVVKRLATLGLEPVFGIPDIERRCLQRYVSKPGPVELNGYVHA